GRTAAQDRDRGEAVPAIGARRAHRRQAGASLGRRSRCGRRQNERPAAAHYREHTMNAQAILLAMLPEHLLLAGIVVVLCLEIASPRPRGAFAVSLCAVAAATLAAAWLFYTGYTAEPFAGQYSIDPVASLGKVIVLGLAALVLLISRDESAERAFPVLFLSSLYGVCLLLSSDTFLTLFLGLELMSLPVYVLVLLAFRRPESAEAALKYVVPGGTASAT